MKWVKCSERLPEVDRPVLVTLYGYLENEPSMEVAEFVGMLGEEAAWFVFDDNGRSHSIIAWMELPEPYKP